MSLSGHMWANTVITKGNDVLLRIRVQPKASKEAMRLGTDGGLRIAVMAPAVDDAANKAVILYLSKILKKNKKSFVLVSGRHSREKSFLIQDISQSEVLRILEFNLSNK